MGVVALCVGLAVAFLLHGPSKGGTETAAHSTGVFPADRQQMISENRLVPEPDAFAGVLSAELVAVLRHLGGNFALLGGNSFALEETLLGPAGIKGPIKIPGFRLATSAPFGQLRDEPITEGTRILTFLKRVGPDSDEWQVVPYKNNAFWVEDPAQVGKLRDIASDALRQRQAWLDANAVEEPAKRVAAIWPFLWIRGSAQLARRTLMDIGEPAGDYLAERLGNMPHNERMRLLNYAGFFGGEKLHHALRAELDSLRARVIALKASSDAVGVPEEEKTRLEWEMRYARGEIYYGLGGLGQFEDRGDLPFIRDLALWAVTIRDNQICEAALGAFHEMPADENLPVIETVWQTFRDKGDDDLALNMAFKVMFALYTHKTLSAVPVLIKLLGDKHTANAARRMLTDLAGGQDLGDEAGPWLDWYRLHQANGSANARPRSP